MAKRRPDDIAARVVAFGVFLAMAAGLAWIHRDDIFPQRSVAAAADDPVARCLAPRVEDIEALRADDVIDAARAALFTTRAEALCQAQYGPGPGPPGN